MLSTMLESLLSKLERERRMIKAAPLHFMCACILAVLVSFIICFGLFETGFEIQHSTIEAYHERFGDVFTEKASASGDQFISQIITNFDGTNLVLNYEPIPGSMEILCPDWISPSVLMERWGYIDGKTFVFTNNNDQLKRDLNRRESRVQYFTKSSP